MKEIEGMNIPSSAFNNIKNKNKNSQAMFQTRRWSRTLEWRYKIGLIITWADL